MDKTIIARDGTKIKFRRGQARDARVLAVLFDMSIGCYYSKEAEIDGSYKDEWVEKVSQQVQDPKSDIWFGHSIVAVIQKQIAGMVLGHLIPKELSQVNINTLNINESEKNILKIQKSVAGQMWFKSLAVFPQHSTNFQLGKKLADTLLKECFEKHKLTAYCIVHETNQRAEFLYKRLGAQNIASFPVGKSLVYGDQSKWFLMKLDRESYRF